MQKEDHSDLVTIYVLRLEGHRFYVGSTKRNVKQRFLEHVGGGGSVWTQCHEPLKIIETRPDASPFQEDAVVLEYMQRYGPERVRGGTYSQRVLTDDQNKEIQQKMSHASHRCLTCHEEGHFARYCPNRRRPANDRKRPCPSQGIDARGTSVRRGQDGRAIHPSSCRRCGRMGHSFRTCFAMTHVDGRRLAYVGDDDDDDDDDSLDSILSDDDEGQPNAAAGEQNTRAAGYRSLGADCFSDEDSACSRCGRDTHTSSSCYAKTDHNSRTLADVTRSTAHASFQRSDPPPAALEAYRARNQSCFAFSTGCTRCGRSNHTDESCFARTRVDGRLVGETIRRPTEREYVEYEYVEYDDESDDDSYDS